MSPMSLVDIGGGFPGNKGGSAGPNMPSFQQIAATVRSSIDEFKQVVNVETPRELRFIAEPGRYFVSASTTIATKVYARKGGKGKNQALYVDDGVYGSFNNVVYDHAIPTPVRLTSRLDQLNGNQEQHEQIPTAVFGPTCDGLDQLCALSDTKLERVEENEWLIFENFGAYTHTASFVFNGYTHVPKKVHCISSVALGINSESTDDEVLSENLA